MFIDNCCISIYLLVLTVLFGCFDLQPEQTLKIPDFKSQSQQAHVSLYLKTVNWIHSKTVKNIKCED